MSDAVLDASALLAFLLHEDGADKVEDLLTSGATCGAANWSETAQKIRSRGKDWDLCRALFDAYELNVDAVTTEDAEWAAARWRSGEGLSLADRLCLALARRLGSIAWTADSAWSDAAAKQIR